MKGMNLLAIAKACAGTFYGNDEQAGIQVSGVVIDSRKVEPGGLFIAIKGNRSDGHDYIQQVYEAGAACCVSEKILENCDKPYIKVESTLKALRDIAAYYRQCLDVRVVGVTGSVGKTSTKETIAAVLSRQCKVLKTEGNYNNEIGLPLTVFRLQEDDEIAVLEMGISDFGEMERLSAIAKPDICVITNIGTCHLENLKDRDGVLAAKTECFRNMTDGGCAVLNGNDDKLATISLVNGMRPVFFGGENWYVTAKNIANRGLDGLEFTICFVDGRSIDVSVPIPGAHMVDNALAAACVANLLGISLISIKEGLAGLTTLAGRNNIIRTDKYTIIDDCYNANPVSMEAAIDVLDMAITRKVAVLGDMFELGDNEAELHSRVGKHIAECDTDVVVTIGNLAKNIHSEVAKKDGRLAIHFDSKEVFLEQMDKILEEKDTILVKASHGMGFDRIVQALKEQ